jgi:hypothetical protein
MNIFLWEDCGFCKWWALAISLFISCADCRLFRIGIAYMEDSNCVSISISKEGFACMDQYLGLPAIFLDHMNSIPTQAFQFSKEVEIGNLYHGAKLQFLFLIRKSLTLTPGE